MNYFESSVKIPEFFGDFGGSMMTDSDIFVNRHRAELWEKAISSEEFDRLYPEYLKLTANDIRKQKFGLTDGTEITYIEDQSRYYSMAAQLAVAKITEKTEIDAGLYLKDVALKLSSVCKQLGFTCKIVLSQELSRDEELVKTLEADGTTVDNTTCLKLYDLPHALFERAFFNPENNFVYLAEGNLGIYPKPGLIGLTYTLFGKEVLKEAGDFDCCVVPTATGSEALGIFKLLIEKGSDVKLVTVEEPICQEYHLSESGTYTICTKPAHKDQQINTTICPELANWWRLGSVVRLGADKLTVDDLSLSEELPINHQSKRAIALTKQRFESRKMLVIGGKE